MIHLAFYFFRGIDLSISLSNLLHKAEDFDIYEGYEVKKAADFSRFIYF